MRFSQGRLILENIVIDSARFEVRPKTRDDDIERYYDSFISHVREIGDYFEDTSAFDKAVNDATDEKRPKLIAREPKYPFLWGLRSSFSPFNFLNPSARRLNEPYFVCAQCITRIPSKREVSQESESQKPLDERLQEDISKRFEQHPGYEGILEIPNDRTQLETKFLTFHESLHYVLSRYQVKTERKFVGSLVRKELPSIEKYQAEHLIHERVVEILTDKLLNHDPNAQFEGRWLEYSLNDGLRPIINMASAITTGILLGSSISRPYLFPLAFVPGRVRDYVINRYKKSKRDEVLRPVEYPTIKI